MTTETRYTVRQLAKIAGVSVRTLHHYDAIGLLRPPRDPSNGYRRYDHQAVLRLQQILFLRELGLSLDEIRAALDRPDFDLLRALEQHRKALRERQERLARLAQTVERTIQHLRGEIEMSGDELFVGFTPEQEAAYEEEAAERWGDGVHESNRLWRSYSDEKKRAVLQEGQAIYRDLIAAMPEGPASAAAQDGIRRWHENMRNFYEPTPEVLLGLGNLYNDDPAFNATFVKMHPDLASFMREAIKHYVAAL
ncbi:MAG: MerR family transcriptional regulator [Chloroflexi bacterium]|nr:MerR family transcriptional regulator [Chloroflexota bacterium]